MIEKYQFNRDKYLKNYSHSLARHFHTMDKEHDCALFSCDFYVNIPLKREFQRYTQCIASVMKAFDRCLRSFPDQKMCLVINLNVPREADRRDLVENERTLSELIRSYQLRPFIHGQSSLLYGSQLSSNLSIVVMDMSTLEVNRMDPKKGVGSARRAMADFSVYLAKDSPNSSLIFLDADCQVPEDYFLQYLQEASPSSALYSFVHTKSELDKSGWKEARSYELYMKYFKEGLLFAGLPYACYTLGSIIVVKSSSYIAVRGIPEKSAGEDFHFLAKILKIECPAFLSGSPIHISTRKSSRVPFGSGPAFAKISEDQTYWAPSPMCFYLLKRLNSLYAQVIRGESEEENLQLIEFVNKIGLSEQITKKCFDILKELELSKKHRKWTIFYQNFDYLFAHRIVKDLQKTYGSFPIEDLFSLFEKIPERPLIKSYFVRQDD